MNRKDRRKIERKMKKLMKQDVVLIEFDKQNEVYESDELRVLPKSWMQNILDSNQVSI